MKSPGELADKLRRQWALADNREQRLLNPDAWPIALSIGKPTPQQFTQQTSRVREHLERWRAVPIGKVIWQSVRFRSGSEPVDVPVTWQIGTPAEWATATNDCSIQQQFSRLNQLQQKRLDPRFHKLIVRQLSLIEGRADGEVVKAAQVAAALKPGCAEGRSLRAMQVAGIDSKFLERNRRLVTQFLDVLFAGQVSDWGLEAFLGAIDESEHWLVVAPLSLNLLPFAQQQVRASELASTPLPGSHVLIVENVRSLHQLPAVPNTTAVLGAGLNLAWMSAPWLSTKRVAYWGDLDTWGLQMLASARASVPALTPLLMTRAIFDTYAEMCSVPEDTPADEAPPSRLTADEAELYRALRSARKGRLEQEFISPNLVGEAVRAWRSESGVP